MNDNEKPTSIELAVIEWWGLMCDQGDHGEPDLDPDSPEVRADVRELLDLVRPEMFRQAGDYVVDEFKPDNVLATGLGHWLSPQRVRTVLFNRADELMEKNRLEGDKQ